ncbi:MAG: thiamine-monophosphate kinase [Gammaproteobacteria bacterium SG8_47]|nr:MAG: thiamine-monophosphate kinase [Gammaproteobacteria bacterium SG8_47]
MGEFDIIERFFRGCGAPRADVVLGIGDDAALVTVPKGCELAVAVDTLVEGVHFPHTTAAADVAYKAVVVNLSDLAAMGAEPAWFTLALTLPAADEQWLEAFARGLSAAARTYGLQLVGGDTTRGPLTVTVQVAGHVPQGQALRRSGARAGDGVYVTGVLGDAALALEALKGTLDLDSAERDYLLARLNRPVARIGEGLRLRGIATAAIDISDGLAADLRHILDASGVGALLNLTELPHSAVFESYAGMTPLARLALSGGDDYELCFTIPASEEVRISGLLADSGTIVTRIGVIEAQSGLRCRLADGSVLDVNNTGYEHFKRR